jgi:peptidoglycan hydrolase-like protein with peptidoglycan-binding domain
MSRSTWAAAVGASVFAFALTPLAALAASPGGAVAGPASAHAKPDPHRAATVDRIIGVSTRPAAHPRRRPAARHAAARPAAPQHVSVLLALGSGYRQAAGLGRVRVLQRRLAGLGFAPGPIDGRYGPLTTQAVERFQGAVGLTVDGIVGAHTLSALNEVPSGGLLPGAGYQLPAGMGRVRVLQRRLAGLGFAPGPIDGRYGPRTRQAVTRFQVARGLSASGIVGAHTLRALRIARRGRIPVSRPRSVPQTHPIPQSQPAPLVGSAPAQSRREQPPALPVTPLLVGLTTFGLATILLSYTRTRARVRRNYAQRLHDVQAADPRYIHTTHPRGLPAPQVLAGLRGLSAPRAPEGLRSLPAPQAREGRGLSARQAPEGHPAPEVHPVPEFHLVPLTRGFVPARRKRELLPAPPLPPRLWLAAVGLATISVGYGLARARERLRRVAELVGVTNAGAEHRRRRR